MNGLMFGLAWLTPLLILPLAATRYGGWATVLAVLPALTAAIVIPAGTYVDVPWLLLGTRLGLDANANVFLLFSAVLWLAAAAYTAAQQQADSKAVRFRIFFLLAMCGNFGLILGQDLVSFYLGFALMGLAAYGLVVHDGTTTARRAGRIYLVMTLIAEFALLFGLTFLYWRTGSLTPDPAQLSGAGTLELALLILAFGIKGGMIGLHLWLPLAHPAAPVPASAVLSGAMIKTALIGWIRYLPLGHESLPEWGLLLFIAGAAGTLLALPLGLQQRDPKVLLAYSSIAKMGTMMSALGLALIEPGAAPAIVAVVTLFAAHHGLCKGALFIGVGVVKNSASRAALVLLALPALALAGLPFTSGALAKTWLNLALLETANSWSTLYLWLLSVAAIGTALLMARLLYLMHGYTTKSQPLSLLPALPWLALLTTLLLAPLVYDTAATGLLKPLWPIAVAAATALVVIRARPAALLALIGRVPPGDIVAPLSVLSDRFHTACRAYCIPRGELFGRRLALNFRGAPDAIAASTRSVEDRLLRPTTSGLLWLAVLITLLVLLVAWP